VPAALIRAREDARNRRHEYVGTEHLLLGLLAEAGHVVADVCGNLGFCPSICRCRSSSAHPRADDGKNTAPDLPYTVAPE